MRSVSPRCPLGEGVYEEGTRVVGTYIYLFGCTAMCIVVVYRCADARGGGIGSTRGSPSESGTFHCRTRGGRIAIVLVAIDPVTSVSQLEKFPVFPRGRKISVIGQNSSRNWGSCFLVLHTQYNSHRKCVSFAIYWNGVNPPRPVTHKCTESWFY